MYVCDSCTRLLANRLCWKGAQRGAATRGGREGSSCRSGSMKGLMCRAIWSSRAGDYVCAVIQHLLRCTRAGGEPNFAKSIKCSGALEKMLHYPCPDSAGSGRGSMVLPLETLALGTCSCHWLRGGNAGLPDQPVSACVPTINLSGIDAWG